MLQIAQPSLNHASATIPLSSMLNKSRLPHFMFQFLLVFSFFTRLIAFDFDSRVHNSYKKTLLCLLIAFNFLLSKGSETSLSNRSQQASYHLMGSSSSYAQYLSWYPCLNGTLVFEFKTSEPNGLLVYSQSLPYKYIQLSLVDGHLRMRMKIGEKDNPRGVFLVYQSSKLNDQKWHEVRINRMNERTMLTVDNNESLYHVHKDANLDGYDLYFGSHVSDLSDNNLLVIGGLPTHLQTYDLSLGTVLFEHRFNGFIRNVRAVNCSAPQMSNLQVISSNNLRFIGDTDACFSAPCLNKGVCLLVDGATSNYRCDCSFTNYEGKLCEKCKFFSF